VDDQESFAVFYRAHRDELHAAVTVTLGDHQLAVEAVDEAFVRAAERWDQVQDMDRPAGWVYRVAVNWATSWRRKWLRRPTLPAAALDQPHHDVLPDPDLAEQLASLPVGQRQMLVLHHALGYTVPEVAALLGVAEGTVKSRVHRARLTLQDRLGVEDGTV
jgi:RNA polymerase sigma factor (sigma-70 family)